MRIRKAKKEDFEEYLKLKKQSATEYSKLTNERITFTNNQAKKEFDEFFSLGKRFLLVAEENEKIIGYLIGTAIGSIYKLVGYIDDIFVSEDFRRRGAAKALIIKFIEILKQNKIKKCRLGVNLKNKKAIRLYKKLGFKIKSYEMDKKLK